LQIGVQKYKRLDSFLLIKSILPEDKILSRLLLVITSTVFFFCLLQVSIAAGPEGVWKRQDDFYKVQFRQVG